jgi:hypothetical protein
MARTKPRLSAAARGLGSGHRSVRQHALATMAEGQQCFRCELRGIVHRLSRALISRSADGKRWVSPWLDLDDYPGRAVGGPQVKRLSGRKCNRSHGQQLTTAILNARTGGQARQWATSRRW